MVHSCFVYNCPIGLKSCKEKVSIFKVPNDARMLQKWRETVPQKYRTLMSTDRICEKHFESRYVIPRYQQVKGDYYQDLVRPKLAPNAVPTIFPNTDKVVQKSNLNGIASFLIAKPRLTNASIEKEPESLHSLIAKEISAGIEVSELDYIPVCFNCLVGKCPSHTVLSSS